MRGTSNQLSSSVGSSSVQGSVMPGIVACTKCNSRYAEGVKYCGRCGNSAFKIVSPATNSASISCPKCSANLPANSKFCGGCGFILR